MMCHQCVIFRVQLLCVRFVLSESIVHLLEVGRPRQADQLALATGQQRSAVLADRLALVLELVAERQGHIKDG